MSIKPDASGFMQVLFKLFLFCMDSKLGTINDRFTIEVGLNFCCNDCVEAKKRTEIT